MKVKCRAWEDNDFCEQDNIILSADQPGANPRNSKEQRLITLFVSIRSLLCQLNLPVEMMEVSHIIPADLLKSNDQGLKRYGILLMKRNLSAF